MITLTLLHPIHFTPVQSWTFSTESVIGIGRASNNDVVLYSSVVSRHHVQIRNGSSNWEIINLGANGTYVNGQPVTQMEVTNNMTLHLAKSGPRILIRLGVVDPKTLGKVTPDSPRDRKQIGDLATSKMTFLTARIIQKLEEQGYSDPSDN